MVFLHAHEITRRGRVRQLDRLARWQLLNGAGLQRVEQRLPWYHRGLSVGILHECHEARAELVFQQLRRVTIAHVPQLQQRRHAERNAGGLAGAAHVVDMTDFAGGHEVARQSRRRPVAFAGVRALQPVALQLAVFEVLLPEADPGPVVLAGVQIVGLQHLQLQRRQALVDQLRHDPLAHQAATPCRHRSGDQRLFGVEIAQSVPVAICGLRPLAPGVAIALRGIQRLPDDAIAHPA